MLVESTGYATFTVFDPLTERETVVRPEDRLTPLQARQMAFQPDMILEFAHHLEDLAGREVEVRAEVYVTMNGRPSRLLIDPTIDLTRYAPSLLPQPFILE